MIVVSDTSPLNYLILIEAAHILPILFETVYVPHRVAAELDHATAPEQVRSWIAAPPIRLSIRSPTKSDLNLKLDPGEVDAICLAEELHADHLSIDEWAARFVARPIAGCM